MLDGKPTVFETDLFIPIIGKISDIAGAKYEEPNLKAFRVIADHMRAAAFILGDDSAVTPANTDQGYILRRLIRRTYRYLAQLKAPKKAMSAIAAVVIDEYKDIYPELARNRNFITEQLDKEEEQFGRTLEQGMKLAKKMIEENELSAENAFRLYDTYGFPFELTQELAAEKGISLDGSGFDALFKDHQAKSHAGAEQKFKGGLADTSVETVRLHTAAHLLHGALRRVLGDSVFQRGANITSERLRFDFSLDRKMTPEEIAEVETIVNGAIVARIPVSCEDMSIKAARESGAVGIFDDKYGSAVKVYDIPGYDREICGGPHVENTGELGRFKIVKEESVASGVRRIKATLE
jgi:alanyl-tRNA synthetase